MGHTRLIVALIGSLVLLLPHSLGKAQDRSGSGDYYVFEDPVEPEPAASVAAMPTPTATPLPVTTPPVLRSLLPPPKPDIIPYEDRALDVVTRRTLTQFASEGEFRRYLKRFEAIKDSRMRRWTAADDLPTDGIVIAAAQQSTEDPCTDPEQCPAEAEAAIVMTASRVSPPNITNTQSAGVDEGDIVKQIGDYFLVLQDGRVFAVNIRSMKLTDRADVYRRDAGGDPIGADWYDEMLVQGDHVLITAYSYQDSATELSVLKLDQASGKLSRLGVFLLSSDDYYDSDNYATRIVGDKLVLYAPYELDALKDRKSRPVIRRWLGAKERDDDQQRGKPLIDARNLYWPVMRTGQPTIHTVSVCPLGDIAKRDLSCRTTGLIAPQQAEMFVSPDNVYLWTSADDEGESWRMDDCTKDDAAAPRPAARDVAPGVVYRVPVHGGNPALLPVRGQVFDQFSMNEFRGRFHALVGWRSERCDAEWQQPVEVALLDVPIIAFSDTYAESSGRDFRAAPPPGKRMVENRFVDNWLVYGGRDGRGSYPPDAEDGPQHANVIAIPLRQPERAQLIEPGHELIRLERVGDDVMLSGYRDPQGLRISMVKLNDRASLAGQILLPKRFESEGRSHAFNSIVSADGSGILGIPTVKREGDAGRWSWRSSVSDISFLSLTASGEFGDLGFLPGKSEAQTEVGSGYTCEVSCIDWYGNSRPIFTDGRIFGLVATDLVEARIEQGQIREVQRVDLTGPLAPPQ